MLFEAAIEAAREAPMLRFSLTSSVIAGVLSLMPVSDALATAQRTFVASTGNDANPCSLTQPCRSFQSAHGLTAGGGEIVVLDSAGYGQVFVSKSISIVAPPGVYAGITVSPTSYGVGIYTDSASDTVILRGLTITGQGTGIGIGISFAGAVTIEGCNIGGVDTGISFSANTTSERLVINDTTVRNSNSLLRAMAAYGVGATIDISRSRFESGKLVGIAFIDMSNITIHDTVVRDSGAAIVIDQSGNLVAESHVAIDQVRIANNNSGLVVQGIATIPFLTSVSISNSIVANNKTYGVNALNYGYVRLMNTQITGNGMGTDIGPTGVIGSLGNNMRAANGSDGPAPIPISAF